MRYRCGYAEHNAGITALDGGRQLFTIAGGSRPRVRIGRDVSVVAFRRFRLFFTHLASLRMSCGLHAVEDDCGSLACGAWRIELRLHPQLYRDTSCSPSSSGAARSVPGTIGKAPLNSEQRSAYGSVGFNEVARAHRRTVAAVAPEF